MTEIKGMPQVWKASDMTAAAQARWLAKNWLPAAGVSILIGDEGIGKSLFWVRVAAAVTSGKPLHEIGLPARPGGQIVVLVITEDDWGNTVYPRLVAAEADLENIRVISADTTGAGAPEFPRDLDLIEEMEEKPAMVVVDTWIDTLAKGVSLSGGGGQSARKALLPMKELATKTGASVLLVTHTNRAKTKSVRDKYGTSSEIRKAARMTLFAQKDDEGFLAVGPEKSNLTAPMKAATFQIKSVEVDVLEPDEDGEATTGALFYAGECRYTAAELVARNAENASASVDRQERKDAVMWLRGFLQEQGTQLSADIKREGNLAGITTRTLQRARNDLRIVVGYRGQPPVSTWTLPSDLPDQIEIGSDD
jgi:RecA-family ATPase